MNRDEIIRAKKNIRQKILAQRDSLSAPEAATQSQKVFEKFIHFAPKQIDLKSVKAVALYSPIKGEVQTRLFHDYFKSHSIACLYPRVEGSEIEFYEVDDPENLKPGAFGILEPAQDAVSKEPDIIFLPGAAFDLKGSRLGFGGGFYDRHLGWTEDKPMRIGLGFDFQLLDALPVEIHDQGLDAVITDKRAALFHFTRLHEEACAKRKHTYTDPHTGYVVFTRLKHLERGSCCKSGCRHCPYGYSRV